VILLAVVVALLVMAVAPAAAFAADTTVVLNNNLPSATDTTLNLTISTPLPGANYYTTQTWARHQNESTWYSSAESAAKPYTGGTTGSQSISYTLVPPNSSFFRTSDHVYVTVRFYVAIQLGTSLLVTKDSNEVTLVFSGPPVSVLDLDQGSYFHPGREGIWWTNGDKNSEVVGLFDQKWNAPMGTTAWTKQVNNGDAVVQDSITWNPWGTADPSVGNFVVIAKQGNPQYSNDGKYTVQHWAVDMFGNRQVNPQYSVDTFGYDTKAPYVVWHWPATTTGYYNTTIAVDGDVIDDGGSGVAGLITGGHELKHFTPSAWVWWKSAETNGQWAPYDNQGHSLIVKINAFDNFRWHVEGTIYPRAYYNATYAVRVTGTDYAGNDGCPIENWTATPVAPMAKADASENLIGFGIVGAGLVVDNMAPTTIANGNPASAVVPGGSAQGVWTNKDVVVNFVASDIGGSGIASGVDYTEYIVGSVNTPAPTSTTSGTKGTTVTVNKTASVGPVYVYYRSVDKQGNKENWNCVWVYFDNVSPVLSIAGNTPWYNEKSSWDGWKGSNDFRVILSATDNNSHLATPGIEYQVPNWPMPYLVPHTHTAVPSKWASLSQNPGEVFIPVDPYPQSGTDGIWPLNMRATDMAGNSALNTTYTVQIDTRPPTTAGAAAFGQEMWVNGTKPYVLSATDQQPGAGVAVTWYRVDQATPWTGSAAATPTVVFNTDVNLGTATQGAVHTVDFFSIDASTYQVNGQLTDETYPGNIEKGVIVGWVTGHKNVTGVSGYKSTTVKMDVTAPTVTAMDPKNGNWQKPLATVNFAGTDVGSGYAYTEWSTDGGKTWTKGEQAQVGGDGTITVTYRGVDNVGLTSANQTIDVKVASTPPTVTAQNSTVAYGKRSKSPTISFNVTSVTPQCNVTIQIRTLDGRTIQPQLLQRGHRPGRQQGLHAERSSQGWQVQHPRWRAGPGWQHADQAWHRQADGH